MKAENPRGMGFTRVGKMLLTLGIAGAMIVGGSGVAQAQEGEAPRESGGLIGSVDDLLDGATCDGPLGGVLMDVGVNCDPEDNPPFQSYEDGEF